MSYDILFIDRHPDESWDEAVERSERPGTAPTGDEDMWRRVADSVRDLLPEVREAQGSGWRELTHLPSSLQVRLSDGHLSASVSYSSDLPDAELVKAVVSTVAAIERETGLTAFDPQVGDSFTSHGAAGLAKSLDVGQRKLDRALHRRSAWRSALSRLRPRHSDNVAYGEQLPEADRRPFTLMSEKQAHRHLERYVDAGERTLDSLARIAAAHGVSADLSLERLPEVLELVAQLYLDPSPDLKLLEVADDPSLGTYLHCVPALHPLLDRASYYLGETFRRTSPSVLRWAVGSRRTSGEHQPVLAGFRHDMTLNARHVTINLLSDLLGTAPEQGRQVVRTAIEAWSEATP